MAKARIEQARTLQQGLSWILPGENFGVQPGREANWTQHVNLYGASRDVVNGQTRRTGLIASAAVIQSVCIVIQY